MFAWFTRVSMALRAKFPLWCYTENPFGELPKKLVESAGMALPFRYTKKSR